MADTAKRLGGPSSLPNTEATLYTVPALTTAIIRNIHVANATGTAATLRMGIGADAAGTRILSDFSVPANGFLDWSGFLVMAAAETLRATGGTNNALTVTVSGVETA